MFGFSKNKKQQNAANKISDELHRQIREAIELNVSQASSRVASSFTIGYLYGFIRQGFTNQRFAGEQLAEEYFKPVCKKIPGNFYKIMREQSDALDISMKKDDEEAVALYEMGLEAGIHDAGTFGTISKYTANNLFNYLSNKPLNINTTAK